MTLDPDPPGLWFARRFTHVIRTPKPVVVIEAGRSVLGTLLEALGADWATMLPHHLFIDGAGDPVSSFMGTLEEDAMRRKFEAIVY